MDELEKKGVDTGGKYLTMLTALKSFLVSSSSEIITTNKFLELC